MLSKTTRMFYRYETSDSDSKWENIFSILIICILFSENSDIWKDKVRWVPIIYHEHYQRQRLHNVQKQIQHLYNNFVLKTIFISNSTTWFANFLVVYSTGRVTCQISVLSSSFTATNKTSKRWQGYPPMNLWQGFKKPSGGRSTSYVTRGPNI